jgi:hypothetical protein
MSSVAGRAAREHPAQRQRSASATHSQRSGHWRADHSGLNGPGFHFTNRNGWSPPATVISAAP